MWRGAVASALSGKRGQELLREVAKELDAMPTKELGKDALRDESGAYCTLGVVGAARGMDLGSLDPEDYDAVASAFGVSRAFVQEIVYMNDEGTYRAETPTDRWRRMRNWIESCIRHQPPTQKDPT